MRRRGDLVVAAALAVLLHLVLVAGAAWCGRQRPLMPQFEFGESSVHLTLVASPPAPAEPEPAPVEPEILPTFEPDAAPVPIPEPPQEEPVEAPPPAPEPEPVVAVEPEPEPQALDGDMQDKGVQSPAIDTSGMRPYYPFGAQYRGEEGLVRLSISVDRHGRAASAEIIESSGFSALDKAAVKAAWKANYIRTDGQIGAGDTTVDVRFQLED